MLGVLDEAWLPPADGHPEALEDTTSNKAADPGMQAVPCARMRQPQP